MGPYKGRGNDLLSHTVSRAVPSALEGLTAEFGMGSGVSPPLWSPLNVWRSTHFVESGLSQRASSPTGGILICTFSDTVKPHGLLVVVSFTCYHAFTPTLSTS